jgi:hypothetical protein
LIISLVCAALFVRSGPEAAEEYLASGADGSFSKAVKDGIHGKVATIAEAFVKRFGGGMDGE